MPDISRTTSKPSTMPISAWTSWSVRGRRVDDVGRAHPRRELAPERVRLADDDVAGAGMAGDGGRHQPDRAGADDQHVLAEDGEAERRVDGVAERVEDRGDLLVDARPVVPDVRHRQRRPARRTPRRGRRRARRSGAEVPAAGPAVAAAAADDMALAADDVARLEVRRRWLPTSRTSPTNSWPTTSGGWIVFAAHAIPDRRCGGRCRRCPVLRTAIRTSSMPMRGLGDVGQLETGPGSGLHEGAHQAISVPRVVVSADRPSSRRSGSRPSRCPRSRSGRGRPARGRRADRGTRRRRPACRSR